MWETENLRKIVDGVLLTELFHYGKLDQNGNGVFVSSGDRLWLFGGDDEKNRQAFIDMEEFFNVKFPNIENIGSFIKIFDIIKNNNNIVLGILQDGIATVYNDIVQLSQDLDNSNMLRKLKRELNINNFKINGEDSVKNDDSYKPYYHGTNLKYSKDIIINGLDGGTKNTNWPKEVKDEFEGRLYLTTNFKYALKHASRSATFQDSLPVVFQVRIRNEGKLGPDRDIGNIYKKRPFGMSKSVGILSYFGKIPLIDIKRAFFNGRWMDIKNFKNEISKYENDR